MWYFVLCYLVAIAHYGQGSCPLKYGDAIDTRNGRWYVAGHRAFENSVTRGWGDVTHMETHRFNGNWIFFSDATQIGITDKNLTEVHAIAGSYNRSGHAIGTSSEVRFNGIWDFTQLRSGPSVMLIADSKNHCIRSLYRENGINVDDYAGKCTELGFVNGLKENVRMNTPRGVIHWPPTSSTVYISDSGNNALRVLNINNRSCTTLSTYDGPPGFNHVYFGYLGLVFTSPSGLLIYKLKSQVWTNHIQADTSAIDGSFSVARLVNPLGITAMSDLDLYALADEKSLRFADFYNRTVTTACSGLGALHGILYEEHTLYIGIANSIVYMTFVKGIEALTTPPTATGTRVTCSANTEITVIVPLLCLSAIRLSGMLHL